MYDFQSSNFYNPNLRMDKLSLLRQKTKHWDKFGILFETYIRKISTNSFISKVETTPQNKVGEPTCRFDASY